MDLIGGSSGLHVLAGIWPLNTMYNTGSPNYSVGVNMGKYDHACFVVMEGAGGAGTATITMQACTDSAGTSPTAIAFRYRLCSTQDVWGAPVQLTATTGYLMLAAANKMVAVEIDSCDLTADKPYVRMALTVGVATAVQAGVFILVAEARYPQSIPITALA